ncbi:MAG: IPTL-CTERM sorting domain-containing protein, partial [Phycisphaerae bacterium]
KTWQATIDPSGYTSGLAGFLTPWNPNCVGGDDLERDAYCAGLLGNGSWCDELGNEGYPPTQCCPGFQDSTITPNLLLGIYAVFTSSIDFAYGSTSPSGGAADTGVPAYGGTLVLDVDSSAKGTFTIPFIPGMATFMKDTGNRPIPLVALVPAKITIEIGRCCYGIGGPDAGCIDDVTRSECDAMPGPRDFAPGALCSGGCPTLEPCCLPDRTCELNLADECTAQGGWVVDECLGDADGDGVDDACVDDGAIPTVSEWGLIVMALVLAALGRIYFGRHRPGRKKVSG